MVFTCKFYDKTTKETTECTESVFLGRMGLRKCSWEPSKLDIKHNNRLTSLVESVCLGLTDPTDLKLVRALIMDPEYGCIAMTNDRDSSIYLLLNIPFFVDKYFYGATHDIATFVLKGNAKHNPNRGHMIDFIQVFALNFFAADPEDDTKYLKVKPLKYFLFLYLLTAHHCF